MSLRVWLPLRGDLKNLGTDNISVTNYDSTIDVNGKIGSCYSFGTTKSYLKFDNTDFMHNFTECSVSLWLKILSWNTSYATYFQFGLGSVPWTHYIFGLLRNGTGSTLCFTISNGSSATNANCLTPALSLNTWYHLTLTYYSGHCKIYVNGIETRDYATSIVPNFSGITTGTIGIANNLSGYQTNCLINDFRIYNHALSAAEVKEISQGLVLHYKLDSYFLSSGTNLVTDVTPGGRTTKLTDGRLGVVTSGTNADTYFTINLSESIVSGTTYHLSCDASGISEGQFWNFPLGSQSNTTLPCKIYNGHNEFTFTANDIDWGTNHLFMDDANRSDWAHPATFYNFILTKDGTYKVKDSSGYENNGNINNNPTISLETIRYSSSMMFNGVNDSIVVPYNSICPENIFTINLWFKKDSLGSKNYETLFGGPGGFEMDARAGAASVLSLYMASTRSGKRNLITPLEFGKWFMITMTRDGVKERYYVNGIFQSEIDAKSMPNGIYRIGAWASDKGQNYYGLMSDFRIYCTPLSDEDILSLYQVQARIDDANNLHTYEIKETNSNLLSGKIWTNSYANHNPATSRFSNFNSNKQPQFTGNMQSAGSEYIEINPNGHIYEYDFTISVNAGNQFYIGFERYDANKTSRSNNACKYAYAGKPSTDIVKKHFNGTIDLSTDEVNQCKYIALRILNGWNGTNSGVTGVATIYDISLREIGTKQIQRLTTIGQFIEEEIKENEITRLYTNGIVETNTIIER